MKIIELLWSNYHLQIEYSMRVSEVFDYAAAAVRVKLRVVIVKGLFYLCRGSLGVWKVP